MGGNQQRAQEAQKAERGNNLGVYWDSWFANECRTRETKRNFTRWKRDERLKFWREEQVIERTDFPDKQVYLSDPQEWDDQLSWWREDQENELLTLAGVPLTKSKPKKRRTVTA